MIDLKGLEEELKEDLHKVESLTQLQGIKAKYIGKSGFITQAIANIKNVPPEERREYGQRVNKLKVMLKTTFLSSGVNSFNMAKTVLEISGRFQRRALCYLCQSITWQAFLLPYQRQSPDRPLGQYGSFQALQDAPYHTPSPQASQILYKPYNPHHHI